MNSTYQPSKVESKWQKIWEDNGIYSPDLNNAKKPFYNLMMFPYPSAEGMHVGNMYAFTGADVYGRFMRMRGFDVFEPIGLDGFGIHSENYAIKVGRHPKEQAKISEANFYRQLKATGNGFDWSRRLETYDPKYYKWTQWLFIQLFRKGLAYRKRAMVNFCPSCKTVLADEQVIEGKCERCATLIVIERREQWFFRITAYAKRLLENITDLNWSEKVKIAQKQWIGRSEGVRIKFKIRGSHHEIEVFTTRPDTLFGATFIVVAPEHQLVSDLLGIGQKVMNYLSGALAKKTEERGKKDGVETDYKAIHPVTGEELPIWIADYVVMDYGTGAIMGVPAHDERDFEFARKYGIPLKATIITGDKERDKRIMNLEECFTGYGTLIDSGEFSGLTSQEAKKKITAWLKEHKAGGTKITYHLRDWLISRQRYWGPPIPMIYCEFCAKKGNSGFTLTKKSSKKEDYLVNLKADSLDGWPDTLEGNISKQNKDVNSQFRKGVDSAGVEPGRFGVSSQPSRPAEPTPESVYKSDDELVNDWNSAGWFPVQEKDLPVLLPDVKDWKPIGTGKSPLANHPEFYKVSCPNCGKQAKRETDVSDTFLDSSWYFLRYTSNDIESTAFDIKRVKMWLPVKMYIGGAEHSVLHLLYSRFITMALYDLGFISFEEPFSRFYAHGLLIKEGSKMSKSKGNVVAPDEYIKKHGADTLRMYLMFLGPFSQGGDFYDTGIEGMHRFLKRVWTLICHSEFISESRTRKNEIPKQVRNDNERNRMMHKTIKKVTGDISSLRYNTAIASLMEWYNFLNSELTYEEIETFLKLLAPFAPHITEELFQQFFRNSKFQSIHLQSWPRYDPKLLEEQEATIVVQVDGKVRDTIRIQNSESRIQNYVEKEALKNDRVRKHLKDKRVKRVVYVEGKIINFVTE